MGDNGNATLYKKLAAVMGDLNRLPKRGYNSHFKYQYVEDSDVLDAVRKALSDHNIAFLASAPKFRQDGKRTTVKMEFTFVCGDTGESVTMYWPGEAIDGQDKGMSKAVTAATKYFLLKTLLISTGDEPDPDADTEHVDQATGEIRQPPKPTGNGTVKKTEDLAGQLSWLLDAVNKRTDNHYRHPAHMLNALKAMPNMQINGWADLTEDNGLLSKARAKELVVLLVERAAIDAEGQQAEAEQEAQPA